MNHSMINSSVTLSALQQKLDILAANVANVNTAGYKRRDASFEDVLTNVRQQPAGFAQPGRMTPLGVVQGWGAKLGEVRMDLTQGSLKETGLSTDLAIEGNALFEVSKLELDEDGNPVPGGMPVYTRAGTFQLVPHPAVPGEMVLVTQDGYLLRNANEDEDNPFITIPAGYDFQVNEYGQVFAYNPNAPEDGAQARGRVKVMEVVRPQLLQAIGDNQFVIPAGMDADQVVRGANPSPGLETGIRIWQGMVEQSNVDLTTEMTELLMVQRAFQLNARALSSADTMMSLANRLRE